MTKPLVCRHFLRVKNELFCVDHYPHSGRWAVRVGSLFAGIRVVYLRRPTDEELAELLPFTDEIDS